MVKTALVATEWELGKKMLAALDDADLSISVAMWLYPQEYEDWRCVLAARSLDAAGPRDGYGLVHEALDRAGITYSQTPTLMIMRMNDPFIRDLRRVYGKTKSLEGLRLGLQTFGGRFVEDALVYRIR
jgi:hypothetical protein